MISFGKLSRRFKPKYSLDNGMRAARYVSTSYNKAILASQTREQFGFNNQRSRKYNHSMFYYPVALAMMTLVGGYELYKKKSQAECCGIIGYIGEEKRAEKIILEGLQILQYRGYDSCGICTINQNGEFVIDKKASSTGQGGDCIQNVIESASGRHKNYIGIGHTRWATHGGKTDLNSHPHTDLSGQFSVVHNGMVENFIEIKDILKENGIIPKSETDTEIIALYTKFLQDTEGLSTEEAFRKWFANIEGSNCCLLIDKEQPDKLFAAKNAGSLLIGIGDKGFVISSQVPAFQSYTNRYIQVPNNEVVCVTREEIIKGDSIIDQDKIKTLRKEIVGKNPKPGYKWFFEQEIFEQAEAVSKTLNYGARIASNNRVKLGGLETREDDLISIDNLIIGAWGTSLYSGCYAALLMKKFQVFESVVPQTASDINEDYLYPRNTGVLSITQSGETEDLKKVIRLAQSKDIIWFNVINEVESEIARMTELGVFINAGREVSVASTKAFLCQAVALSLVTIWFAEKKHPNKFVLERIEFLQHLKVLWMKIQETLNENRFEIEDLAKEIKDKKYIFVLGKGLCEPIAKEAALKIKEVTYIHAEGYSSGEFKHGPLALVEEDKQTVGVIYILDDENFEFNMSTLEQLKAKQAYTIVITDCKHKIKDEAADKFIRIPYCGDLTALLGVIPMQLLTLYLAQLKGNDVDKPRNLAKTVTV